VSSSLGMAMYGAVALLLLGFAVQDAAVVRRLQRAGIRTQGVVVGNTRDDYSDCHNRVPVIAFVDQQRHRWHASPSAGHPRRP